MFVWISLILNSNLWTIPNSCCSAFMRFEIFSTHFHITRFLGSFSYFLRVDENKKRKEEHKNDTRISAENKKTRVELTAQKKMMIFLVTRCWLFVACCKFKKFHLTKRIRIFPLQLTSISNERQDQVQRNEKEEKFHHCQVYHILI